MTTTCGIDWSERHHDVAIVDADAAVVARARVSNDATGFGQLMRLLATHAIEPTAIEIAIETDKGLLVAALRAAGLVVGVGGLRDQSAGGGAVSGAVWPGRR